MTDVTSEQGGMPFSLTREQIIRWAPVLVLAFLVLFFPIFEWLEDFLEGKDHIYLLDSRFFSIRNASRIAVAATPALMVAIGVTSILSVIGSPGP